MALSDLKLPTYELKIGSQSVVLYGLTLENVTFLIQRHREELDSLVEAGKSLGAEAFADNAAINGFLAATVKEMPKLVGSIIACASGDTSAGAVEIARRLPLPRQTEALEAIARLTFEESGGVKKFVDDLKRLVGSLKETPSGNSLATKNESSNIG